MALSEELMREQMRQHAAAFQDTILSEPKKVKKAVEVPPAAAAEDNTPPVMLNPAPLTGNTMVVLVGAGGTGARVLPPIMQILRPGSKVVIMDHDIVEDRNLLRQHFTARDVGSPKALVLADRYRKPGIETVAFNRNLVEGESKEQFWSDCYDAVRGGEAGGIQTILFIGCVDNSKGRRAIRRMIEDLPNYIGINIGWIDVGNDMRSGQMIFSASRWLVLSGYATKPGKYVIQKPIQARLRGLEDAMPQLLRESEQEKQEASCGDRLDIQTVQVNMMAASCAVNMVSSLLLGLPMTNAGVFFDTINSMQPIKLAGIDVDGRTVRPETSFAIAAEKK